MWNAYRSAWSLVVLEAGGSSSYLGEVWYAEAERPEGPWTYARKVVTHEKYSFYNPRLHPYFARDGGRMLYFEGTYTRTFSGNADQTPRYDYNQIMYRLDLSDPRLNMPRPIVGLGLPVDDLLAAIRPGPDLLPVVVDASGRLSIARAPGPETRFYVVADDVKGYEATSPLREYEGLDGKPYYSAVRIPARVGMKPTGRTLGRVWPDRSRKPR